ncbi:hypothetical protein EJ06DRAFT_469261 [Trichodelitschia bisporula]|uniref:Fms interacting protein n=1 Tax=Trichodelitschia bisporula TaxID=703511 RepID=A0A6G1IBJ8_9PEZI|nr:hypothetical protein EJ06DRAFT_469261 [Trichodelitschia bisporula]
MTADTIVTDPQLRSVLAAASLAREQCLSILALLEKHYTAGSTPAELQPDLAKQQKALLAQVAQMRYQNRTALLAVRATKQATADARLEVDTLHLQLQNLYYEQRHLIGEIALCENYDHKYQSLPLIPVEQFLEQFPEHRESSEHDLMVARIEHEHVERQALEEKRQGLLKRKQGLIAENNKRKENLENLDKDLEKFIDAATPIMKTFEKEY